MNFDVTTKTFSPFFFSVRGGNQNAFADEVTYSITDWLID